MPTPPTPRRRVDRDAARGHDEATPSQLDRIAEINARSKRLARSGATQAAWVGAAVLLALASWWLLQDPGRGSSAAAPERAVPAATGSALPLSMTEPSSAPALPTPAPAAPEVAAVDAQPPTVAASAPAADRARKARAREEAQARATLAQQEDELARSRADEQDRQRREAERARALAEEAGRRPAEPAPARAQPAPEPRRSVQSLCAASGNFLGELFCHARECRKGEQRDDAICVRLRDIEEAQRRGGQQ